MEQYLTSADVAKLLGVGPTSVKRWADSGLLPCLRTPGKHRRFAREEVERFRLRHREEHVPDPAHVGAWVERIGRECSAYEVHGALLTERSRLGSWWRVAELLGAVLNEMGERWQRGEWTVLAEHSASERLSRGLTRCLETLAVSSDAPTALLATAKEEDHTLGLLLAELCLREHGWAIDWAGRMSPTEMLVKRIEEGGCEMVAMSASPSASDAASLRAQAVSLGEACARRELNLVLGGGGPWPEPAPELPPFHRVTGFQQFHELLARFDE